MNDPRGSMWRLWDLHFHTPASYDYDNGAVSNQQIIDGLLEAKVAAVAITDHNKMDVERIKELQEISGERLTIFPGIELRTDKGSGSKNVHLIGIFPEACDLVDVWTKLSARLEITAADLMRKGDEKTYVQFIGAAIAIHELGGLVSVHAGTKTNSIERGLANAQEIHRIIKTDLATKHVDIYEIGKPADAAGYHDQVFPEIGKVLPLIIGSDNHNIRKYAPKCKCWIKADTTFEGLRQVISEPIDRVYLGPTPEKTQLVNDYPSRFLDNLKIVKNEGSELEDTWFDVDLDFNPNLIAIIGNKGNGKSALADILGLLGDTTNTDEFSFLSTNKFRDPKQKLAREFTAVLTWKSGISRERLLSEEPGGGDIESVKLIPQSYLENVCNVVGTPAKTEFDVELEEVIFSHVGEVERLGCATLAELIEHKTNETQAEIRILADDVHKLNRKISRLEEKSRPEYRIRLENTLRLRKDELDNLKQSAPTQVPKPGQDASISEEEKSELSTLDSLRVQLGELKDRIEKTSENLKIYVRQKSAIRKLKEKLSNFEKQFQQLAADCEFEISQILPLSMSELVEMDIHYEVLDKKLAKIDVFELDARAALSKDTGGKSLLTQAEQVELKISQIQEKLDEPNRQYQKYLAELEAWRKKEQAIIGDDDTPNTMQFIQNELDDLQRIPDLLAKYYEQRTDCVKHIFQAKRTLADSYTEIYRPVQTFIEEHSLVREKLDLQCHVTIRDIGFKDRFLTFINRRKAGSFCGSEEGESWLDSMLVAADFDDEGEVLKLVEEVIDSLRFDRRASKGGAVDVQSQLRTNATSLEVYDFICQLEFLEPRYVLKQGEKSLNQLSPGEKGTLLVIFYLLIDKRKIPLVIDQPEGNLDSETVFKVLVPCVKEAKKSRQIFLVTHNPNLAVVCDAEQVIHATMKKLNDNHIQYQSGSIENPHINRRLSDVLEGTMEAFRNRDDKYHDAGNYTALEVS